MRGLSVYDGFFAGGARVLHSDVLVGLHEQGDEQSVLSVYREVRRENTVQHITQDYRYQTLVAAGVAISCLDLPATRDLERDGFTDLELRRFADIADKADVVLSLKEQPLRLLEKVETGKPLVVCLHRSDPEHQGAGLDHLRALVARGAVSACVLPAEAARAAYVEAGIPASLLQVVANGVNLDRFTPSDVQRVSFRTATGIASDAPTVVFAARYDAMKNVPLFLAAAAAYLDARRDAHVVICGAGMTPDNADLRADVVRAFGEDHPSIKRLHLLGIRHDMETVYAGADVVALTSAWGEASPLCLLEGMACGAVPVSTDVGDTVPIVGSRGIVTGSDAVEIAQAWQEAVARRREYVTEIASTIDEFDRHRMIARYRDIMELVTG